MTIGLKMRSAVSTERNKVADVNMVNIAGPVTWFQNWKPRPDKPSWGGSLAMRISLKPLKVGEIVLQNQEVFVKISYPGKEIGKPRLNYLISQLESGRTHAAVINGTIVSQQRSDKTEYFVKGNLGSLQVFDPSSIPSPYTNLVVLRGQCTYHETSQDVGRIGWIQIQTAYINPAAKQRQFRIVNVMVAQQIPNMKEKWIYISGQLATKDLEGNKNTYVMAREVL